MLMPAEGLIELPRNARAERGLWHDSRLTPSLGCTACPNRKVCGGLQVESPVFDCLSFCCGKPEKCDAVCRNKPQEFARRVWEIGGFSLDNVARAAVLSTPRLPKLVPELFHGDNRKRPFDAGPAVCLPLYKVMRRHDGNARYKDLQDVANGFQFSPSSSVILRGADVDRPLERWWSLGPERLDVIRALRDLGVALVTTPNFSLFTDQPRWDDMHSMKRIALVHEEFLRGGVPAALHLNARTDRDWERWREYISARPEVTHVAFEFATGAGWPRRIEWHADQLAQLAAAVGRPLHLIVRGGNKVLPNLVKAFSDITVLETTTFFKTMNRQRAGLTGTGAVGWVSSPTPVGETLDNFLAENWQVVAGSYAGMFGEFVPPLEAVG